MKVFKIESRRGWVALPERIAGYAFPLSFGDCQGATCFFDGVAANNAIKKHSIPDAHLEEFEIETKIK